MNSTRPLTSIAMVAALAMPFHLSAHGKHPDQAGWVEKLTFDDGKVMVKAKLDSGAKTSSINAENIERFERDDEKWVRFELKLKTVDGDVERLKMERPLYRNVQIKEHEGENDRRPVVKLDFCFDGKMRDAQFTLVDRSKFIYPVLLGRRFLSERVVINPGRVHMTEPDCKASADAAKEKAKDADSEAGASDDGEDKKGKPAV